MTKYPSACPLDCPDSCSLSVTVEAGRVTKIEGSHANPLTAGFLCDKVRRFDRELYGEHRILYPRRRIGPKGEGRFERISWEQAYGLVADRLSEVHRRAGGDAILPLSYGGSNGYLTQDTTDARLFRRLDACRVLRTVCAAPSSAAASALYGKMPGVSLEDFPAARTILLWGVNPSATGIHLVPKILEARKSGAKLAVVDPRTIPLAKQADLHLPLRPGTDLPLALALIRWLFENGKADLSFLAEHAVGVEELQRKAAPWTIEEAARVCEIPPVTIVALAEMWAGGNPSLVRCGWGPERNRNGGSAIAAILALPAVAGKFGVRGGGYTASNSGAWKLDSLASAGAADSRGRQVNMNQVGGLLSATAPGEKIELLFVYNMNPAMTLPRQDLMREGLLREDLFTVVYDPVMTDTARYADVLLPATTFLEHRELRRGYGAYVLQDARPVVPTLGESRPNYEVFGALVGRLGLRRPTDLEGADELVDAILATDERVRAPAPGEALSPPTTGRPVLFEDAFPGTPDGKIHLFPEKLDQESPEGLYTYRADPATEAAPLALISPALREQISSTFGALSKNHVPLWIHPRDARPRGIRPGATVRVYNEHGEVLCPVRVTEEVRPGVVFLAKGLWSHHTVSGTTTNALAPDTLTDFAGGACFNDARVEVRPA